MNNLMRKMNNLGRKDLGKMRVMNNLGRGDWVLMFVLLVVGVAVVVMATTPTWTGYTVNYTSSEEVTYNHNLSANITGYNNDVTFEITPSVDKPIYWTNSSGTYTFTSTSVISSWISITDTATGNLKINATYNNHTGYFKIPIQATNTSDKAVSPVATFNFIINATNDAPNFTSSGINDSYTFTSNEILQSFNLTGADEEGHYPLVYNITFNDTCQHGAATGYSPNLDCNLSAFGLSLTYLSNTTSNISFAPNSSYVGTYWANISVMDAANGTTCPHNWCDATYNTTNSTTYYSQMVLFTVSPTLTVDASNCSGVTINESEQFNCTIVITSSGQSDELTLSSNASFKTDESSPNNASWFHANDSVSATNFNYNVSISVNASKREVGNWTINFSTVDSTAGSSNYTLIDIYVNYTESNVTLDSIADLNGSNALYEDYSFEVNATDEDLLIADWTVKYENLTFASNTSWVSITEADSRSYLTPGSSLADYISATVSINHTAALEGLANPLGGNYTVNINVTDDVGSSANRTFVIEIRNETAPEWNSSLSDPVVLNLVEGTLFQYNVSVNVTDAEGDAINFSYQNVSVRDSGEFCSLNSTNFNSTSGIINFTPTDCDVGYHNVTIIATDGYLNSSKQFNFTVTNIADSPTIYSLTNGTGEIANGSTYNLSEGSALTLELKIEDHDFLIPAGQQSLFYNESLTIDVVATNRSSGQEVDLFNFSFVGFSTAGGNNFTDYNATFTPTGAQVDNYTIWINITDNSGISINRTFYLNISETSDPPNLTTIDNQYFTIHDYVNFTVNATDDEDDRNDVDLEYNLSRINTTAPDLTIGLTNGSVVFDLGSNESYSGVWHYNISVNDSGGGIDFQIVYVYIYGNATLVSPTIGGIFNLTENVTASLNFTINHSVGDNLTYEFWTDSMNCSYGNSSNCNYREMVLRQSLSAFGNNTQYNWSFTANFTDETYGNLKNITLRVYPNSTNLNSTQKNSVATNFTFKLNVSHTNAPLTITVGFGERSGTYGSSSPITVTLTSSIRDYDYLDSYYLQNVTFTVSSDAATTDITAESSSAGNSLPWNGTINDWSLQLYASSAVSELITISANDSSSTVTSNPFNVTFTAPSTTTTPVPTSGGGGGTTTKLKHYSLKLIVPQDVLISDQNYIDIPFSVQNNGQVDLVGISLSSFVRYNDEFSDDVRVSLADDEIPLLKFGQSENFSMRIFANTQKSGRYKATILANVTSPKFSDWGEFFIDLRTTNETEAEQILIFTEKLIADNPECLELTELINEAERAFALGEYSNSLRLAKEATEACEDAILANEQIKYPVVGFVKDNFYYISFSTLAIFLAGFIFYVYKRVRFNKYEVDKYV